MTDSKDEEPIVATKRMIAWLKTLENIEAAKIMLSVIRNVFSLGKPTVPNTIHEFASNKELFQQLREIAINKNKQIYDLLFDEDGQFNDLNNSQIQDFLKKVAFNIGIYMKTEGVRFANIFDSGELSVF